MKEAVGDSFSARSRSVVPTALYSAATIGRRSVSIFHRGGPVRPPTMHASVEPMRVGCESVEKSSVSS